MSNGDISLFQLRDTVQDIDTAADADAARASLMAVETALERIKAIHAELKAKLIEWVKANGDLEISPTAKWIVGHDKTVKCRDVGLTIEAMLNKSGGDLQAVVACLSSNAIKHGTARKLLGDEWEQHFEERYGDTLELKKIDTKFLT